MLSSGSSSPGNCSNSARRPDSHTRPAAKPLSQCKWMLLEPQWNLSAPRCGLSGKGGRLIRTECCGQWIGDDEAEYVLFSYARNSCHRNHRRLTLCACHHGEGHAAGWQTCPKCRESFPVEIDVWSGTNEYNFVKLENPPAYQPMHCDRCGVVIRLSEGGYSQGPKGTLCERCTQKVFPRSKLD